MKAFVDKTGCISCGLCISICPAVFTFDSDRKAQADPCDVPEGSIKSAISAREACPASVIDIEY
jgi:ferredoxin